MKFQYSTLPIRAERSASAEDAARRIRQGFQLVTCMNDLGFFRSRTNQHIQTVRQLVTGE